MPNFVYIAASLDGYIARKDGNLDWLNNFPNPEKSDFGFYSFMEKVDAIVMGRKTFETVLSFNEWVYTKPVFVLSRSLKKDGLNFQDKFEILNLSPGEIPARMNQEGFNNLYIDGGATISSFLSEGLIDEITITTLPLILGEGIPLFGNNLPFVELELKSSRFFSNSMVQSHYLVK